MQGTPAENRCQVYLLKVGGKMGDILMPFAIIRILFSLKEKPPESLQGLNSLQSPYSTLTEKVVNFTRHMVDSLLQKGVLALGRFFHFMLCSIFFLP